MRWQVPIAILCILAPNFSHADVCVDGVAAALEDLEKHAVPEVSNHNRDPQFVPLVDRHPGMAEVEWGGIRGRIEDAAKAHGIDYKDFTTSIYVNGVEKVKGLPWRQTSLALPEAKNGQIDYYVVYKHKDGDIVDISKWNMRETSDMRTLAEGSFTGKSPGEHLSVQLSEDLKAKGMSEDLTKTAVRLANKKVVWDLSDSAPQKLQDFVSQADTGVDVTAKIGKNGKPTSVTFLDRTTGKKMSAKPSDISLTGDAAFSGNKFFWDDMWVAGGSVHHNPELAKSTIEYWLDVSDKNNGLIPREVRKANKLSLWFANIVKFPEPAKPNLTFTNPNLMSWAADKLYRYNPSKENLALLKRVAQANEKYMAWLEDPKTARTIRDAEGNIIGFNGSALGTGLDNSRYNVGNSNELAGHQRGFVDFLSQQIAMLKDNASWQIYFARDASAAEKTAYVAKARELRQKAQAYSKILNEKYWDPESKFYYDIHPDANGVYVRDRRTTPVSGFWPLFANASDPAKVDKIVETQMVPSKFGGEAPMVSNSRAMVIDESVPLEYTPRRDLVTGEITDTGYHDRQHTMWPPNVTMGTQGFRQSGRPDVAHEVARAAAARMAEHSTTTVEEALGIRQVIQPDGSTKFVAGPLEHGSHPHRPEFAGWGMVQPLDGVIHDGEGINTSVRNGLQWTLRTPLKVGSSTDKLGVDYLQYRGGTIKTLKLKRIENNVYLITVQSDRPFNLRLGSLLDSNDQLTPKLQSIGKVLKVEGDNKKRTFRVELSSMKVTEN